MTRGRNTVPVWKKNAATQSVRGTLITPPCQQNTAASKAKAAPPVQVRRRLPYSRRYTQMQDIRCGSCSRKLGQGEYITLSIKCPRCGTLNHLRAKRPDPERLRAPHAGVSQSGS
ncbi:Com family DNA-binding transcriptional regulator [Collimonas silvisoli]|uniref:Com family DNA-binding transcriptional regulator n=1 Tax=Collimonas silvisoli TaxID=2825884 RepID=UPI002E7690CA|nr:Com family DNA-binding transcriptional regulator [Collimonas silvisoli]